MPDGPIESKQGRTQNIFSGGAKPLLKNFLRISSIGKHILLEFFGGAAAPLAPPAVYGHGSKRTLFNVLAWLGD